MYGYGKKGDVAIGISTSGNSKNVVNALIAAKAKGMFTVALTGAGAVLLTGAEALLRDADALADAVRAAAEPSETAEK